MTDEDGDVTHSDSLQSDKEETPSGRPTKRARLARETALKTTPKSGGRSSERAKGIERPRRETRKSGIVDRLSEKLALMDDDHSRTPPPPPAETPEPMDTDVPQTPTKTPEVATANENSTESGMEPSPVKVEPDSPSEKLAEKQADKQAEKQTAEEAEKAKGPGPASQEPRPDTGLFFKLCLTTYLFPSKLDGFKKRVLLLTRHALTLRDFNDRQMTRTQLYWEDFNAR